MKHLLICLATLAPLILSTNAYSQKRDMKLPYGDNRERGKYANINGINIYYEEYGEGEPLLIIHGNGGKIKSMHNQIDYFKHSHRVIAVDCRGHGKSGLDTDSLTYEQMAKDVEGLIQHLRLDSVSILGWSDGGIIGLKMAISKEIGLIRLITMGMNIRPDTMAVQGWAIELVSNRLAEIQEETKGREETQDQNLQKQLLSVLIFQPQISHEELSTIETPVLVMNGDRDIIRNNHALEIYNHIPFAQLCIMPGIMHGAPLTHPKFFNSIVEGFLNTPVKRLKVKKD